MTAHDERTAPMEPISLRRLWSDYWKVPVVGLLAAVLAFIGSFLLTPTYQSSTHLLVRARNTTFLSGNGTSLNQTPAVLDSDLAKALSDTQGALAATDTVARMVVTNLHLDKPKPKPHGVIGHIRRGVGNFYRETKAFLLYGGYKKPNNFDGAVQAINRGLSGVQVKDSFILELTAKASGPKMASQIADASADAIVKIANDRFASDSAAYRDLLAKQLNAAQNDQVKATQAVAGFEQAHGISDVTTQINLTAQNQADLKAKLQATQAQLSDTEAQLASVQGQLARTPSRASSSQTITTGRSSTVVDNSSSSTLYDTLLSQQATLRAQTSGLSAQSSALRSALENASASGPLTQAQARLQQLALDQSIAQQTVTQLATQYQQAKLNTVTNTVELTRVDNAAVPVFPVAPRRYLFLAVGLILGMMLGFVASQLRVIRRRRDEEIAEEQGAAMAARLNGGVIDLSDQHGNVAVPAQRADLETLLADQTSSNGSGTGQLPAPQAPEGEH
jgi:uncharacterized protein involved in exopolysaccharide biosynthesis